VVVAAAVVVAMVIVPAGLGIEPCCFHYYYCTD